MPRNRLLYLLFLILVILSGLASRHYANLCPAWVQLYLGDALWALMVFILMGMIFNRKGSLWIALAAVTFSFCVEFSQLYHAPWIDSIRSTRLGGLVLGFGFLWSDLICYLAGISIGFTLEILFLRNKTKT
jgi:hypothetical protein